MSLETSGYKPGDKIDLDNLPAKRFERKNLPRPETYWPQIQIKLLELQERLTSEYGDLFTSGARIKIAGGEADRDQELVRLKESGWAEDADRSVEDWRQVKEKDPANLTEAAITLLFDKIFHQDFIIVRASDYDDYENGADQLIIDKKTGAVICGVDDVIGRTGHEGSDKKEEKIRKKMEKGGAFVKYALTVQEEGLARKSLSHVPLFYFALSPAELNGLLAALSSGGESGKETERKIGYKLCNSLIKQVDTFAAQLGLDYSLKYNLKQLEPSLTRMISAFV